MIAFFFALAQVPSEAAQHSLLSRYPHADVVFAHVSTSGDARSAMPAAWQGAPARLLPLIRGGRVTVVHAPHEGDLDANGVCRCGCGAGRRADGGWYDTRPTRDDGSPLTP